MANNISQTIVSHMGGASPPGTIKYYDYPK